MKAERSASDPLFVVLAVINLAVFVGTLANLAFAIVNAVSGDGETYVLVVALAGFLALQIWCIVRGFAAFNAARRIKSRLLALVPLAPIILWLVWLGAVMAELTYYGLEQK